MDRIDLPFNYESNNSELGHPKAHKSESKIEEINSFGEFIEQPYVCLQGVNNKYDLNRILKYIL